ncbi:hypothetical protein C2845_PM04G15490 [Panicum miliaceum]|uniref:F-box domain-containing protein n=1 Tax=Panicum miliaceum TaxID=4540 RepID=A0A3L6QQG0_PANMI|nr:hypothetical protein C2845_PM04G15490 [Panicum miliaceum]
MASNRQRRPRRRRDAPEAPKPTVSSRNNDEEPPVGGAMASTTTVHDIPDHVLKLALLRLVSPVCLVRAASACKPWCRVVADAGFLARFRLLRVPRILGLYLNCSNPPVFLPSAAPSIPISQSFSLDFLAEVPGTWETVDSRDGLLLLQNRDRNSSGGTTTISMSNFRVIVVLLRERMLARRHGVPEACMYQASTSTSNRRWSYVSCAWKGNIDIPCATAAFYFVGRAGGSLYWAIIGGAGAALVLDEATAAVSLDAVPAVSIGWREEALCFRVIGGEDGTLRAVHLSENNLRVFARQLKGGSGGGTEWVLQKLLRLPKGTDGFLGRAMIVAEHDEYVLVAPRHGRWLFSVDLKTMTVERFRERNKYEEPAAYPYGLPWPPTLKA